MRKQNIYTIGYGNRPPNNFFAIIPKNTILIDVRNNPVGWSNQYSKNYLKKMNNYVYIAELGNAKIQ